MKERGREGGREGGWEGGGEEGGFPDRSHLQYLFACSMQIRRRKAWEIWSHAVMSGRQRVDIQGAVPDEVLKFFLVLSI